VRSGVVSVATLATALGVAAAFALDRGRFAGRGAIRALAMAPMIMPGTIMTRTSHTPTRVPRRHVLCTGLPVS
jgi:hypothetical protein